MSTSLLESTTTPAPVVGEMVEVSVMVRSPVTDVRTVASRLSVISVWANASPAMRGRASAAVPSSELSRRVMQCPQSVSAAA